MHPVVRQPYEIATVGDSLRLLEAEHLTWRIEGDNWRIWLACVSSLCGNSLFEESQTKRGKDPMDPAARRSQVSTVNDSRNEAPRTERPEIRRRGKRRRRPKQAREWGKALGRISRPKTGCSERP